MQLIRKKTINHAALLLCAQISHTAGLMSKLDPASGQIDQAGQAANLPDLTRWVSSLITFLILVGC